MQKNTKIAAVAPKSSDYIALLYNHIAPEYHFGPIVSHLRNKFKSLDDSSFALRLGECLKFLYLRSVSGRGFIPLSGEIDDFWHELILQTNEYQLFCSALPSKAFIHHNSITIEDYTDEVTRETSVARLLEWIPSYVEHFGYFTKDTASYWMVVQLLINEFNYSLAEINELK